MKKYIKTLRLCTVSALLMAALTGLTACSGYHYVLKSGENAEHGEYTDNGEYDDPGEYSKNDEYGDTGEYIEYTENDEYDEQGESIEPVVPDNTETVADTFVSQHGALHVDGTNLVDEHDENVQLYGMSTHGLSFYPQYVNKDTFTTLRDDWNTNCIRLAMYTAESGGYCTGGDRDSLKTIVRNGIDYASSLGMYVIVDWHILSDCDPNVYKQDAKDFFAEISSEYADYVNILYEICNEPNGYATWDSVKSYAEEVIPCIRENDPDAVILVGSPTWSQDIDKALADPLQYDNIMYTLHFYAGTHKDELRDRLEYCVGNGLPVFISEFGMCDASGGGGNDFDSTLKWMELIEKYDISYICWNLANKNESSSVIRSDVSALSDWSEDELSESGRWIRDYWRSLN